MQKNLEVIYKIYTFVHGEMAEWSNAVVLKTIVLQGTGGSNPSLSAESHKTNSDNSSQTP